MAAKVFATRLAGDGIPVFEVRPGIIATDMTANVKDVRQTDREWADSRTALGAAGRCRLAVAALLRGDFHATGSVIHVDGGLALPRL